MCYLIASPVSSGLSIDSTGVIYHVSSPYFLLFSCREAMGHSGGTGFSFSEQSPGLHTCAWGQGISRRNIPELEDCFVLVWSGRC